MAYGTNFPSGLRPSSSQLGGSWTEKSTEYNIYASVDGATTEATSIFQGDPVMASSTMRTANTRSIRPLVERYTIDTTLANSKIPTITNTPSVVGVFAFCEYTLPDGRFITDNYWRGGTAIMPGSQVKVFIYDDPMTVFDVQVSTSTTAIKDAIFAGDYTSDTNRKPSTNAYFGQNFMFGLSGATFAADTNYPGVQRNPVTGDVRTGISRVYLDVGQAVAMGAVNATANRGAYTTATTVANVVANDVARRMPLKAIGFTLNSENEPTDSNGFVRPFLNVRVLINNHFAKAGTVGTTPA